jgi:protein-tyrosine phosphatase
MTREPDAVEVRDRLVPLTGAYNFRDLGGYPTRDGRVTRWNRLFRSDALHELTESDVVVLRDLGLASVIDLRTITEVERTGRGILAGEAMYYEHLSVTKQEGGESQAAPTEYQADLADRYLWYLEVGADSLASALVTIADPRRSSVVFHCAAGKDRTGVLAALVLDILGVEREAIVGDYAITGERMPFIMDRLRRDPAVGDRIDEIPPHMFAVDPRTMERFLDLLDAEHGGAYAWARGAGVAETTLSDIREHLLAA